MKTYVSKPTEVQALQFTGTNWTAMREFTGTRSAKDDPQHLIPLFNRIGTYLSADSDEKGFMAAQGELWVEANGAWLPIEPYEWVLKDSLGFYPCKDEVFRNKHVEKEN